MAATRMRHDSSFCLLRNTYSRTTEFLFRVLSIMLFDYCNITCLSATGWIVSNIGTETLASASIYMARVQRVHTESYKRVQLEPIEPTMSRST